MVTIGDVACPRCDEDRVTMISVIIDPMGKRYYCSMCAYEFREQESPRDASTRVARDSAPVRMG